MRLARSGRAAPRGGAPRRPRARDRRRSRTTRGAAGRGRCSWPSAASPPTATSSSRPRGRRAPWRSCSEAPPRGGGPWVRVPRRARGARRALRRGAAATRPRARPGGRHRHQRQDHHRLPDRLRRCARRARRVGPRSAPSSTGSATGSPRRCARRPSRPTCRRCSAQMVDAGCRRAVLEVSSHSLALQARPRPRVHGGGLHQPHPRPPRLPRRHGRATSRPSGILFDTLLRADGHAIVNLDDDRGARARPREPRAASGPTRSRTRGRPPRRGACASRSTAPASAPARRPGVLEVRDAARRPLQRPERARARSAPGLALGLPPDAVQRGIASLRGRAGPHGARRRRARTSRCSSTTPTPTTRSRTCSRPCASCSPRRVDHRLRLRRRPRPHQAPADGRGGRAALATS